MALALGVLLSPTSCANAPPNVRFAEVNGHRIAHRVRRRTHDRDDRGLGDGMATSQDVAPELATTATVILYDRAGYDGNDATAGARDARAAVRELFAFTTPR